MLHDTIQWWLAVEAIGLIALPIALFLFRTLPGRGIAFAKPLGLLLTGYLFWIALTLHVLPNRPGSIVLILFAILAVDYLILRRHWGELREAVESRAMLFVASEVVFLVAFFTAAHIKSFIPEINGTEKPMDFLFLNAASRSTYYPPADPWMSGFDVSYYYFGYVIQAMTGKLAGVPAAVAFNLALASTAALAAVAAFGLGYEVVKGFARATFGAAVAAGIGAILLVTVIGNLEGVLEFGAANGALPDAVADAADVANLAEAPQSNAEFPVIGINYPSDQTSFWWWWRATRISPDAGTITEFPFFSFILGDLHPHVMSIPFVLLVAGLGLAFWRREKPLSLATWGESSAFLGVSGVIVGSMGFINTWDLPTFGFLFALLALARNLRDSTPLSALQDTATFFMPLAAVSLVLYAPFYFGFGSQASGIDAVVTDATSPSQAILFWGPLFAVSLPLPVYLLMRDAAARTPARLLTAANVVVVLLLAWAVLLLAKGANLNDAISERGVNWLVGLFFAASLIATLLALWRTIERRDEDERGLTPVLAMMATAYLLIFGAELFFVSDVFDSRLNTVFKLYYQAWLLLGVAGAAGGWWLVTRLLEETTPSWRVFRFATSAIAMLLIAGAVLYPLGATLSRTEGLAKSPRSLDGLAYTGASPDTAAAKWLHKNTDPGERIVEAVGGQYSPAGRISAWTGIPTILGWPGHEKQWGRDDRTLAVRTQAVKTIYESASLEEVMPILQQYGVTYVVVGSIERATYAPAGLQKFETGPLTAVFSSGDTVVYRVPPVLDPDAIAGVATP
jgi:YYY domain-containing protein